MTITPQEAARALKEVEDVADRSLTLKAYRAASPALILWGCVWFVVNLCCDRWPQSAGAFWLVGDTVGILGSVILGAGDKAARRVQWRSLATVLVALACAAAVAAMAQIRSTETLTAFYSLLVGGAYMIWGVWRGVRIFTLGLMVVMISMFAGLAHPPHAHLLLAVNGGGALILAGLWFRRA